MKIRVTKLSTSFGVGDEYRYAIQLSEHGLIWSTVARFKTPDEALGYGKELADFMEKNFTAKPEVILWTHPKKHDCNLRKDTLSASSSAMVERK